MIFIASDRDPNQLLLLRAFSSACVLTSEVRIPLIRCRLLGVGVNFNFISLEVSDLRLFSVLKLFSFLLLAMHLF